MTIILPKATPLADILNNLGQMSEVEATGEEPLIEEISPSLLKKAKAVPRLKTRLRKTLFVTLGKD